MAQNRMNIIGGSPEVDWEYLDEIKTYLLQSGEILAVDKGLEICNQLNLPVKVVIGDLDSVDLEVLEKYSEIPTFAYPPEKNKSDLELAVEYAIDGGYDEIWLYNCTGGRLDHLLFNIFQLFEGSSKMLLVNRFGTLQSIGANKHHFYQFDTETTFSIIPIGPCSGVSIQGAKYPLYNKELKFKSLTLSNEGMGTIEIEYKSGQLLLFIEGKPNFK